MITIKAQDDLDRIKRLMGDNITRHIPYATAVALTELAKRVRTNEIAVMHTRLKQPTRWTINSLYTRRADWRKRPIEAHVWFNDYGAKGTPAEKYMPYSVYGGQRKHKRFEKALIARGLMQPSQFVVPGSGAQIDSYGNMSKGQIVRVMSGLKAFSETGYDANATNSARSRRKGNASKYFVATISGQAGVWERVMSGFGDGVKPIMLFTDASPYYRKRYPFFQVAENIQRKWYFFEFEKAFNHALATAK
jgi:hypothetical protein